LAGETRFLIARVKEAAGMIERLKTYLRPPVFADDEEKTFSAGLVHIIAWALLLVTLVYTLLSPIPASRMGVAWLYELAIAAVVGGALWLTRRGLVQPAALLLTSMLWLILTVAAYSNGGVLAPAYGGYVIVVVIGGLLLGWPAAVLFALLSTGAGAVMLSQDRAGLLPEWRSTYDAVAVWGAQVAYLLSAALLLTLALQTIRRALTRAHREIAERRKAEQALRHSEQRFRAIFDTVNDAIFVHDLSDGRILDVNQKMGEMYGYTADEARGLIVGDISAGYAPYTQDEASAWMQQAAGQPQIFEWLAKDRAGRLFWVEVNMRRAAIDGQDRLLVVVRDIDERKRTEAALRREQAYYQAIVNATPVMLWLKDTENRVLRVNPAAAKVEGADTAELEGKSAYDLYPREQAEAYYRDDLEVIRSGQPRLGIVEQYQMAGTGQTMWVEMGKIPVRDDEGNIVGVLACAVDITARKEAERVQTASRQIAEAALLAQNLEEFYQAVYATFRPIIPANNFYISLYDETNDLFIVSCLFDEFDQAWAPYRPGKGLSAYVMRTGEPLLVTPDVFAELERQGKVELLHRPMVEWLGVPLKTAQGILGVMAVQNYSGPARLREEHKGLLVFVSAQVAMAIERKRAEERERRVSQGLRAVIATAQELIDCADLDTLYRRSVELARERLGLERCGLYLLDDRAEFILGTFGTGERGQTIDERQVRHPIQEHPEVFFTADRLWVADEKEFTYWNQNQEQALAGRGWHVAIPIRSRKRTVGVLYNDAAITRAPLDETRQDIAAVYGSLLGGLLELKRTEAELARERDLLQSLMDNAPDTIYFKDADSRFTRINRAQARLLGLNSPEEALGKTDADFFGSHLSRTFLEEERRLFSSGEPIINRLEYNPRADGQPRWLSATKIPLRDRSSRIIGLVGISRDVTEHRLATERARLTARGLHAVIAAADELLACANLDELYRRAVELGRERLGLERCGLFLYDEAQGQLLGTYGTDERGQTTDERGARLEAPEHDELLAPPERLWQVKHEARAHWRGQEHVTSAEGWIACTLLRGRGRITGVLYNDALLSGAPLNESQQEVVAVYCSMLGNLIELKRAEAAVRESEALFRYLADNAPAMISLTDESGATVYLNRAWQEFHGVDPGWQARLYPGDRDRYLYEVESARQARRTYQLEYRLRRQDGQYRWLLDTSVPRFTVGSQFAGFIGIAIDITDRKNAEEALLHSEARLRLVTENMEDSVSQIDAGQRFVYVSPSMERMSGYPLRALLGRSFLETVHPDDSERLQHQMRLASGLHLPTIRLDYRFVHSAGQEVWLEAEIHFMYSGEGAFAGAIISARDISMRKQVELEREKLIKELEDKNAELERFTYTVSHDLKSPLITIRGFLGFLEKDAQAGNLDRLRADIQRISDATSRMQRLLDDLLELSRVGRLLNPAREIPFEAIAREAVELVRGRLAARGIQVEIAPNLPMVYGDRTRLIEVVQNLVDNAAKFMGDQPEPRIIIGVLGDEQAEMPIFFVQDNGTGIDPQYHERIFGLFNKLDTQSEGTGVGLALVKRIINMHGGHIWVESEGPGQGSTFLFTLPQPPAPAAE
jgi:PAS domain S-box-containing protein